MKDEDIFGWIICFGVAGLIFWGMKSCEDKPKETTEKTTSSYTTYSSTPSSPSTSSYTSPSNNNETLEWEPVIDEPEPEPESQYTYTYSSSTSVSSSNTTNDDENYEDWETEDIEGFYVKLDDCESDEQAEYISDQYYSGDYIEDGGDYYARTSVSSGVYEVELGERVNSKMFKIQGSNCYIRFKWSTSLWRWDEGVMDVWNSKGTFYIKPD